MPEPTEAVEAAIHEDGQTIANATLKRAGNDTIIALAILAVAVETTFQRIQDPVKRYQTMTEWFAAFGDADEDTPHAA